MIVTSCQILHSDSWDSLWIFKDNALPGRMSASVVSVILKTTYVHIQVNNGSGDCGLYVARQVVRSGDRWVNKTWDFTTGNRSFLGIQQSTFSPNLNLLLILDMLNDPTMFTPA